MLKYEVLSILEQPFHKEPLEKFYTDKNIILLLYYTIILY